MPAIPPASTSPASAYDLEGFAEQLRPPAILADLIDPVTGDFRSLLRGAPLADAFAVEILKWLLKIAGQHTGRGEKFLPRIGGSEVAR